MTDPLTDKSRWTLRGERFKTPGFFVDGMRTLIRETFGDDFADALEADMPSPYGTLDDE